MIAVRNPEAKYRLSDAEKSAVREDLRERLHELARGREIVTYGELCRRLTTVQLHPHSFIFTRLLREVCGEEYARGNGMLCALVVSKSTGIPGGGYFDTQTLNGRDMSDLIAEWQRDVDTVFALWSGR